MPTIGAQNPELVKRLGLDMETVIEEGSYVGKVCVATFVERPNPAPGRTDPVAYLPPTYNRFGILDRNHTDEVKVGETWLVHPYIGPRDVPFIIPIEKVRLDRLLVGQPDLAIQLAGELLRQGPGACGPIADALRQIQITSPSSTSDGRLRAAVHGTEVALEAARNALAKTFTLVEHQIRDAEDRVVDALEALQAAASERAPTVLVPRRRLIELPVYLADANVFILAHREPHGPAARIVAYAGRKYLLATTEEVLRELHYDYEEPVGLKVLSTAAESAELLARVEAHARASVKSAGDADLSLVRALIANPQVRGIVTQDPDIHDLHPASLVKAETGRDVGCWTPEEFVRENASSLRV